MADCSKRCNLCDGDVDITSGGCAIMMAFCRKHTTNLINVSFCSECYEKFLAEPMRILNDAASLNIILDDEEQEVNANG